MLKGTPKPALSRRCGAIAAAVTDQLRSRYPCARPLRATDAEPEEQAVLLIDDETGSTEPAELARSRHRAGTYV